jgi:Mrp family chromosome partitioning ATPase/uncharacterized protein involved in exopolysaccharide biosynthesis
MDLVYLFRVLLKKKWIIIAAGILAGAIAWYFTRNEAQKYKSTSRISTGFAVPDEIKVGEKYEAYDAEVKFNNVITTWTSPSVLSLLSYELILHDLKSSDPFRRLKKDQEQSAVYKSINKEEAIRVFENRLDSMSMLTSYKPEEKKLLELLSMYGYSYNDLNQKISINQVQRTDYIEISCMTEHPDLSAYIVNHVYLQFLRYYRGIRGKNSQQAVDTLESLMNKKKQELDLKNRIRVSLGTRDAITENTSTLSLISELEKKLEDEKNKQTDATYSIRKINQKIADLGSSTATSNSNNNEELIIARRAMNEAYNEYLKTNDKALLAKYNQLKSEFFSKYGNTKVAATDKTDETRQKLLQDRNDLEVDIEASKAKINSLQSNINSLKGNVSSTSYQDANAQSIEEEVKLAEREYLDAKSKYSAAYDMSSSAVNNFRQLQLAQPAIVPEPSKRKLTILMAAMAAGITSILVIMLLTYLDSSIKTPNIFSKVVNLKLISMVNFMNLKNKDLKDLVAGNRDNEEAGEKHRRNVFRESIRKLRYEIEKSGKKIFLFTSTKKGQGKTTLITALSYSLSLSKKKVLIVDTNFCNPDLTTRLDATAVLEKFSDFESKELLIKQIKEKAKDIGVGSVFVIGAEGGDYTPSEILPRENLLQHLHELTPEFDYIFLEGPPLNDFSDSKELLQYVDGVVAIFSATHIIKQIDKESINFFKELDGKLIGAVLNMVDLKNVNAI